MVCPFIVIRFPLLALTFSCNGGAGVVRGRRRPSRDACTLPMHCQMTRSSGISAYQGSRILAPVRPRMQAAGLQCLKVFLDPQTRALPGDTLYGRVPNDALSWGTVLGGAARRTVVIPVVIPRFHMVGATTLWRVVAFVTLSRNTAACVCHRALVVDVKLQTVLVPVLLSFQQPRFPTNTTHQCLCSSDILRCRLLKLLLDHPMNCRGQLRRWTWNLGALGRFRNTGL